MSNLLETVRAGTVLVGDGAWGTALMERGLGPRDAPESVNLQDPAVLGEIASLYLDAGADLITTNTFGASPIKLAHYGLEARTEEIIHRAVEAIRPVVGNRAHLSGSVGPTGKMLLPGGGGHEEISESFHRQIAALIEAGVDLICIETMMDLEEALLAVRAARSLSSSIPILATLTFDTNPRGFFTLMGNPVEASARDLAEAGADLIGSNCGNGVETMVAIAREFDSCTDLPIVIQSNAGLPEIHGETVVYPETPEFTATHYEHLANLGVAIIGGCCGTGPDHIRAFRAMIDASQD